MHTKLKITETCNLSEGDNSSLFKILSDAPIVTIAQGPSLSKTEGERVVLNCQADAAPVPSYKWMKGKPFSTYSHAPNAM